MVTPKTDERCCRMKSLSGFCPKPLEFGSDFLSKKWSISIIITIGNFGVLRFNDLLSRLENATAKIVSERLKELRERKIIVRKEFKRKNKKVEYSLTKKGQKLVSALEPLVEWAES